EIADLAAAVVAPSLELVRDHLLVLEQRRDAVGELDLAARPGLDVAQHLEDPRRQNVAPDHGEGRGRVLRLRLLNDAPDAVQARADGLGIHDPVARRVLARHALHPDHGAVVFAIYLEHLLGHARVA